MGRTISFVIAIVVFLFAISLLVVYNTQDFKESFNFKDKIDYSQIEIQKNLTFLLFRYIPIWRFITTISESIKELRIKHHSRKLSLLWI